MLLLLLNEQASNTALRLAGEHLAAGGRPDLAALLHTAKPIAVTSQRFVEEGGHLRMTQRQLWVRLQVSYDEYDASRKAIAEGDNADLLSQHVASAAEAALADGASVHRVTFTVQPIGFQG